MATQKRRIYHENKDFDMLISSIKEAGCIKSGKKKPSRIFEIDAPNRNLIPKIRRICIPRE